MRKPRIGPTRTVIVAGAVTLALGAGSAVAAAAVTSDPSPVSSTGVIDGCWTNAEINGSHVIVLQNQGTSCPKGTTPISWNESGPTGPAGPAGPTGSPGAKGSPGTGAVVADSAPASACPNGGITVTDGSGNTGYVCDGATGSPGPSGPAGPSGPPGTSVAVDTGTVTWEATPGDSGECTLSNLSGPDASTLAINGSGDNECDIGGVTISDPVVMATPTKTFPPFSFEATATPGGNFAIDFYEEPDPLIAAPTLASWNFVIFPG